MSALLGSRRCSHPRHTGRLRGTGVTCRTVSVVASILALVSCRGPALTRAAEPEAAAGMAAIESLRINQLQFIGTHNSYHVRAKRAETFPAWNYSHAPLDVQLDRGVRSFELDLQYRNGVFRGLPRRQARRGVDLSPTDRRARNDPQVVRCASAALAPLILVRAEEGRAAASTTRFKTFRRRRARQLDEMLRSAFPARRMLTPDDVRGNAPTLRDAVQKTGWPTLAASRGKVFFILHDDAKQRELYTHGPSLASGPGDVRPLGRNAGRRGHVNSRQSPRPGDSSAGERRILHSHAGRRRPAHRSAGPPFAPRRGACQRSADREHRLSLRRTSGENRLRRRI